MGGRIDGEMAKQDGQLNTTGLIFALYSLLILSPPNPYKDSYKH